MNVNQPAFRPEPAKTVNISANAASQNVQIQAADNSRHIRVFNSGTITVFIRFGADNTVTATTTTDIPIAPGTVEILSGPHPWVAAIGISAGPSIIYFTPGEGI